MADGYFLTKVCATCCITKPGTDFSKKSAAPDGLQRICKDCVKAYNASYYKENRESICKHQVELYRANTSKILDRNRRWRERNPDAVRAGRDRYGAANAERLSLARKKWVADNRINLTLYKAGHYRANQDKYIAKASAYRKMHPERVSAMMRNARCRRRAAQGTHTAADIQRIFKLQRGKCACCGKRLKKYHVDHIHPLALGGTNGPENLQILCPPCNLSKSAKHPIDFMQETGKLL